ncbi:MAG: hypothetical protein ACYS4W_11205 [Planctomycetota bacterium]|jgi:hypothetical protein
MSPIITIVVFTGVSLEGRNFPKTPQYGHNEVPAVPFYFTAGRNANLSGTAETAPEHIAEAISYRKLDRKL